MEHSLSSTARVYRWKLFIVQRSLREGSTTSMTFAGHKRTPPRHGRHLAFSHSRRRAPDQDLPRRLHPLAAPQPAADLSFSAEVAPGYSGSPGSWHRIRSFTTHIRLSAEEILAISPPPPLSLSSPPHACRITTSPNPRSRPRRDLYVAATACLNPAGTARSSRCGRWRHRATVRDGEKASGTRSARVRARWRTLRPGRRIQGRWHDVVVHVGRSAVQIRWTVTSEAHLLGQGSRPSIPSTRSMSVQDTSDSRLFGEVRNAAFYSSVPTIRRSSSPRSLRSTQCLFDAGFHDSISYHPPH